MENIKKKYKSIERGALIRGIKFEIKLSEYTNYYGKPCHYCGTPAIGLDRIDSALNYTKNNVVTCCHTCNMMKSTLEADAFVLHCSRIALHNNIESKLPEYVEAEENYSDLTFSDAKKIMIENFERDFIQRKLTEYKGNISRTAEALGMHRQNLQQKIDKYFIRNINNNFVEKNR